MSFNLDNISQSEKAAIKKDDRLASFLKKEITIFGKSFSSKKKEDFYTELSVLLKAGITLKEALSLLAENQKSKKHREFINNITSGIVMGQSFSETIEYKKDFTEYEFYSLKIGEETGTLEKVCEQLGNFYSGKNEQKRNLISALTYPVIIVATAVLIVGFMLRFVVPMFQDIFKQNQVELPAITQFIVNLSGFVKNYGWMLAILIIAFLFLKRLFAGKQWFKKYKGLLLLKIPLIGPFAKNVYLSQFTQAVSLLTSSKVPIVNSIQLVKKMIDFYPLQKALNEVEINVLKGKSLSESLKKAGLFDSKMVSLVKVAEETNQTEFIFERLNQQYSIEVRQKSKMLSTVMEPLIILFVGVIVAVILIAMYLPMFKLSNVLG
ncbi:type II secretion system F family protein [Abyssalbus ytuae]|uniref:Type II secretion system F family protein n=1 Tax=Abyssalbus ytuae TaxID=2926907 RepID=A0A9E6ZP24_9FLAO|nr:type II secretion system F family protein [Abyssalbus ytuae]UOB17900.1 type II secretion system F family protein [Abyssalbus ytuae]